MLNLLKKRWYIILIVLVVAGLIIYKNISDAKAQAIKTKTYTVKRQDLKEELSLSGQIDADEHAVLRFQTSGRLSWVGVKEGDYVKKYQGLASLDQRDVKNRLQKYLNTYSKTRYDFDQSQEDNQIKNIGGLSEDARREALRVFDKAQFDLNNSVLDVELQNLSIEYSYLYTPIEGLVTRVDAPFSGLNITPTSAEFEIINPKTIYFSATADQSDVVKISESMNGTVILDAYPDKELIGTVRSISFIPKAGETGTVYEIKIFMNTNNDKYQYKYGMTGDINFAVNEKHNVLSVPSTYIKIDEDKKYVMKKINGKMEKIYVKTGMDIGDNTIITSGLKEGDMVSD
jgi:membrane fusion protein, multidrug efflux system